MLVFTTLMCTLKQTVGETAAWKILKPEARKVFKSEILPFSKTTSFTNNSIMQKQQIIVLMFYLLVCILLYISITNIRYLYKQGVFYFILVINVGVVCVNIMDIILGCWNAIHKKSE